MSNDLRHLATGEGPTEAHIRVLEAWAREHPQQPGTLITIARCNEAGDWWNGGAPTNTEAEDADA